MFGEQVFGPPAWADVREEAAVPGCRRSSDNCDDGSDHSIDCGRSQLTVVGVLACPAARLLGSSRAASLECTQFTTHEIVDTYLARSLNWSKQEQRSQQLMSFFISLCLYELAPILERRWLLGRTFKGSSVEFQSDARRRSWPRPTQSGESI